jgi:CMP-N-acetylneuraminic acid synthetase
VLNVVAFMPMRHSSERVPGKNYRELDGAPLFHHMVRTLQACPEITRVVIDTDSPTVAEQCTEYFPDVLVLDRPKHLLGGDTPMTSVLQHDASVVDSDWYIQTHSTSPLLRPETISAGLSALEAGLNMHDSLFSVTRLQTRLYDANHQPVNHDPAVLLRTQDLPPLYEENSGMYVFSREQIKDGRRFGDRPLLFEIDPVEASDIDEEPDFVLADTLHRLQREDRL